MSLDFARIKEIKLVDVMGRYGVPLRFKGEYAAALCPLPTHKDGDTSKSFSINLQQNYWRCFSEGCNEKTGGKKGGDVISFVAFKEGIAPLEAAKKLATWYGIADAKTKTPVHMEQGSKGNIDAKNSQNITTGSDSVKNGERYMQDVEAWFDSIIQRGEQEDDTQYSKRVLNAIKKKLVESYRSGQKSKVA
jgi:hypothetical protein